MSSLSLTVRPSDAVEAYAQTANGISDTGFGDVLGRALQGVVDSGHEADTQAIRAINGDGNLTEVATAVSHAELALQSAVAIRDKVVQAYQEIMRMPI